MVTVFDDVVRVHYGQIYVVSDPVAFIDGFDNSRGGQVNGLCGAAEPGLLFLVTGLHTGRVRFAVELHDDAPPVPGEWEDVVEASFRPRTGGVALTQWAGEASWPLPLDTVDYRVRYCATGMDAAADASWDGPDRYLLQFWPAPPAPDAVVRQLSSSAAYWHRVALETAPPPTAAERAEAARREREARELKAERRRVAQEEIRWGGRRPGSARLRETETSALSVARFDRDLVDEIDAAGPVAQRAMAGWAARHACELAGLTGREWVTQGLDALDRGDPPPPWFADFPATIAHYHRVPRERLSFRSTISMLRRGREPDPGESDPEMSALYAVIAARHDDPLIAAFDTLRTAIEIMPGREATVIATFRAAFRA